MKLTDKFLIITLLILLLVTLSLLFTNNDSYVVKGDLNITIIVPETNGDVNWCDLFPEDRICNLKCSNNGEWVAELFKEVN